VILRHDYLRAFFLTNYSWSPFFRSVPPGLAKPHVFGCFSQRSWRQQLLPYRTRKISSRVW